MPPPVGDASTAGNRILTFANSVVIGDWIESWASEAELVEEPRQIQCFTSSSVILDGSFPAFAWRHDFLIYMEEATRWEFADAFVSLTNSLVNGDAQPLVATGTNTLYTNVDFGSVFLASPPIMETPSALLLHEAGFFRVQFVGTSIPTVTQQM